MPRLFAILRLAAPAAFAFAACSLVACKTDGAPAPGGHHPPPPPAAGGKMCGGIAGIGCAEGDYCQMTPPLYPDKSGICRPRPQMCTMIYQPVCGMDGETYPNACHAAEQGVSIAHGGSCQAGS